MNLAVEPELGREVGSPGAGSHAWPKIRLGELYSQPSRNGVYKSKEHHGSGVRIVNMGELFAHDFIGPQEMNRLAMTDSEMEVAGLAEGDLLFGRRSLVEAGAGRCSLVAGLTEPATFESSIIRVRLDRERVNPRFFFYWLRSPVGKGTIRAIVTGTNVKGIRGSVLQNIMVPSPEKTIQDRCVSVLSAYDDLIENNRRRIKLLEHAALLQYREWFVFFRFPGHEHVPFVNALPEGWTRKSLRELSASVDYGYTASASPLPFSSRFENTSDDLGQFSHTQEAVVRWLGEVEYA
ncbi:MAG: restriction endonuclease subunit S [Candidatus Sulfotelmatobacter sp.]